MWPTALVAFVRHPPPPLEHRIGRLQIVRLLALPPYCDIMSPRPRRNMTPTVHFPAVKVAKLNIMTGVIGNPCRTKGALPDPRYRSRWQRLIILARPAGVGDRGGYYGREEETRLSWQNIYFEVPLGLGRARVGGRGADHLIRSNG